jgi:hypothetical protein
VKAWIIKWSWIGDHAIRDDPNVGILSARLSPQKIRDYVELIYRTNEFQLREQMDQAQYNNPQQNPYPARFADNWQGNIECGHNPYLEAFLADEIKVEADGEGNEVLSYRRIKRQNRS